MWISIDEVQSFTGITPKHLKYDDSELEKFEKTIISWISQAQDLIKSYTHNQFTDRNVPPAVKNICLRLTANMVALAIERRDTPRTTVTDWSIRVSSSDIFTDDLKEDLTPFVKDVSTTSDTIDFFAITGKDD